MKKTITISEETHRKLLEFIFREQNSRKERITFDRAILILLKKE